MQGGKKLPKKNEMQIHFLSQSVNEAFARVAISAFISQLDPTVEELYDIKMAVSEAVTNAIIHGYEGKDKGEVVVKCAYEGTKIEITIMDQGKGIGSIEEAMQPLYTTSLDEERAGLGFTVMQEMMDEVEVCSHLGDGTTVKMIKSLRK